MTVTRTRHVGRSATGPAADALARARDHLLSLQHDQGWWQGELETNVTMDAEDLLLREFLGVRTAEQTQAAARWIASQQRDDGTWANFYGGPADLSTTVEAYVALRLAGHEPQAPHLARAAAAVSSAVRTPRNSRSRRSSASMVTLVSSSPCHQPCSCCSPSRWFTAWSSAL